MGRQRGRGTKTKTGACATAQGSTLMMMLSMHAGRRPITCIQISVVEVFRHHVLLYTAAPYAVRLRKRITLPTQD